MPGKKNELDPARGRRIEKLREAKGLKPADLGDLIGVSYQAIGNWEEGNAPRVDKLVQLSQIFNVSIDYILLGKESDYKQSLQEQFEEELERLPEESIASEIAPFNSGQYHPSNKIRPVMVPVDRDNEERITLVRAEPAHARHSYLTGYRDPEYIQHLPNFSIPGFKNGTYRAFVVEGHSMLQYEGAGLYDGDIVICSYVEQLSDIKDNRVYVIASDVGLYIKRCINRLNRDEPKIICNSDNRDGQHPPFTLRPQQIIEVWEFRAKISAQLPKAIKVFEDLAEVQTKYTLLSEEMKGLTRQIEIISKQLNLK